MRHSSRIASVCSAVSATSYTHQHYSHSTMVCAADAAPTGVLRGYPLSMCIKKSLNLKWHRSKKPRMKGYSNKSLMMTMWRMRAERHHPSAKMYPPSRQCHFIIKISSPSIIRSRLQWSPHMCPHQEITSKLLQTLSMLVYA